jgi:hypothetical protein
MTYELDGTQYLVVAAGDTLFGFAMLSRLPAATASKLQTVPNFPVFPKNPRNKVAFSSIKS